MVDTDFRSKIQTLIAQVPEGSVTTYGDLAALAGHAHAARIVGGVAHYGENRFAVASAGESFRRTRFWFPWG